MTLEHFNINNEKKKKKFGIKRDNDATTSKIKKWQENIIQAGLRKGQQGNRTTGQHCCGLVNGHYNSFI